MRYYYTPGTAGIILTVLNAGEDEGQLDLSHIVENINNIVIL